MKVKMLLYIIFGIVGSVLPIILAIIMYFLFGDFNENLNNIKMEIIPDLLLVAVAIASNTLNLLFDNSDERFYFILKGALSFISAIIGFTIYYSVFSYFFAIKNIILEIGNISLVSESELLETSLKLDKAKEIMLNKARWTECTWIAMIIIILNIAIGVSIIYRNYHSRNKYIVVKAKNEAGNEDKEEAH